MSFTRCTAPPSPHELAVHNSGLGMNGYMPRITEQHHYWADLESSVNAGNMERQVASALHHEFFAIQASQHPFMQAIAGPKYAERDRYRGLSALAATLVIRKVIERAKEQDEPLTDAYEEGVATMLIDMMTDDEGMPIERRIHLEHETADSLLGDSVDTRLATWYREGDLYIRRSMPANISEPLDAMLQASAIAVDHESMTTLAPYMVAAPFRVVAMN